METCDFMVIGGGIVGLATAVELGNCFPESKVVVVEKEKNVAMHQTGRNSGVIHSGIYYVPGSLKARTCVAGVRYMYDFCREHHLPVENIGKVIVATCPEELPRLNDLYQRGQENGIGGLEIINGDSLREIEPHAKGIRAIRVPSTGIVDYVVVCEKFAEIVRSRGGKVMLGARVTHIESKEREVVTTTVKGKVKCAQLINCAGLHSDRVAHMAGACPQVRIIPFRGEYYSLRPEKTFFVRGLIYPVPEPSFPFLGVHFTKMIDGSVEVGPNAVLSLKREGYHKTSFSTIDAWETLTYPGFWKLARRYWKKGMGEMSRSFVKSLFVKDVQRLVPQIMGSDLVPHKAGVRAQALKKDGGLHDDFCLETSLRTLHVLNAPSPAATASIAIGKAIVDKVRENFSCNNGKIV